MTNHPILSDKAATNTLQPPFSYLEQKKETNMNNLQILKNSPMEMLAKLNHYEILLVVVEPATKTEVQGTERGVSNEWLNLASIRV